MLESERVGSVVAGGKASPVAGRVRWDPAHSLWHGTMMAVTFAFGASLASTGALLLFALSTGAGLLLGHSVGFHRLLIHRSFAAPLWLERTLVWIGTSVGMGGPLWMIRTHDMRDWAQRQSDCHPYLAHRTPMLIDAWWQIHCRLELVNPPRFDLGRAGRHAFYRFLERSWMAQQIPIALLFFAIGGWGWVVWGVCARVTISTTGHWFIGYLAHTRGPQSWLVAGAGVQAHDVPWAAVPTMGEAWHNNHHAFPGSARIGLYAGQSDWGYAFIRLLERSGLAANVVLPEDLPPRHLLHLHDHGTSTVSRASGSISG